MARSSAKNLPDDFLRRPPPEAARLLALASLDEAAANLKKIEASDDPEALHDFRVSIRRLRSTLRAYEDELEGSVSKKVKGRLKALWRSTSSGRDTEVQIAWLEEQRGRMAEDQVLGFEWMAKRLESRREKSYGRMARDTGGTFSRIEKNLRRKLSSYRRKVSSDPIEEGPVFCSTGQALVAEHVEAVEERIQAVKGTRDPAEAHQARIAVKRLRYVIEPLAGCLRDGEEIIEELKGLQDILGDLQDMHVLGEEIGRALEEAAAEKARRLHDLALREDSGSEKLRQELAVDERTGILELARLLRARQDELFTRLESEWLSGRAGVLLDRIRDAGRGMDGREEKDVEIERKFLLSSLPPRVREHTPLEIEQGWVRTDGMEERLRRVRSPEGETFWRTFKVGSGLKRTEIEDEIPRELFEALWPFTAERRVSKRRYRIEEGALVWEIDEFLDRNLHLAEVELPSEDVRAEPPSWLEPCIEDEVTGDPRYANATLARRADSGAQEAVPDVELERPPAG
jgi:CHAD domain-containing protein/CYTH domain-containing protein